MILRAILAATAVTTASCASDHVSFNAQLKDSAGDLGAYGSLFVDDEPNLEGKTSIRFDLNSSTSDNPLFSVDLHLHVNTAPCDLLRMELGIGTTIALPELTDGESCGSTETCATCAGSSVEDIGPALHCEDDKIPLDMKVKTKLYSKSVDFGNLQVSLCKLAGDSDPGIEAFCKETGSDVLLKVNGEDVTSTYTGIRFPLTVEVILFDPKKATDMPKLVDDFAEEALKKSGYKKGAVFDQSYSIPSLVTDALKKVGTSPPSWMSNGFITIGSIQGGKCDGQTEAFGVQLNVDESMAESNQDKIMDDLAAVITKQGSLKAKVQAYQMTNVKVTSGPCGQASSDLDETGKTWICGTMNSGAGKAAGALNTLLSHAVTAREHITVGNKHVELVKMSASTSYTCPKVAQENGGCVSSNPPSSPTNGNCDSDNDGGLSAGAVVGIVFGCLLGVIGIVLIAIRVFPSSKKWMRNPLQRHGAESA